MGKTLLVRLAAVAAGGTLALAAAAPALAHTEPADGFNAVLHDQHHGLLADDDEFDKCDIVIGDAGEDAESLVKEGFDVWVFNTSPGEVDSSADPIATVTFNDLDQAVQTVSVPGTDFDVWIGPESNPHLVAVSVPAGWTLVDGDFNVTGSDKVVRVTHTCAGVPGEEDDEEEEEEDGDKGDDGDKDEDQEQPGGDDESDEGLPVTGMQVGGLVALGVGLLAAGGGAMLAVRRRQSLAGLTDG